MALFFEHRSVSSPPTLHHWSKYSTLQKRKRVICKDLKGEENKDVIILLFQI